MNQDSFLYNRATRYITVFLITLLGFSLRIYKLEDESIWVDEAVSYRYAKSITFSNASDVLKNDRHPPFYYFLLKAWLKIRDSIFMMRLLSVLLGTVTVLLFYHFAKLLFSESIAIISALLLATSPYHIYYSQETRMYTLETFLFLSASYLLFQALKKGRKSFWTLYSFNVLLSLYTHYYTIFLLLSHFLFLLHYYFKNNQHRKKFFINWSLSLFPSLLLMLPWIPTVRTQIHSQSGSWIPPVNFLDFIKTISYFCFGIFPLHIWSLIIGNAAIYWFLYHGFRTFSKYKNNESITFVYVYMFASMLSPFLLSFVIQPPLFYGERYQIICLPIFYLLLAKSIEESYRVSVFTGLIQKLLKFYLPILCTTTIILVALFNLYLLPQKPPWADVVKYLLANYQAGDAVSFSRRYFSETLKFYTGEKFVLIDLPHDYNFDSNWENKFISSLKNYRRLWYITFSKKKMEFPEFFLNRTFQRIKSVTFTFGQPQLKVILYKIGF